MEQPAHIVLTWHVPRWNFATMSREAPRWRVTEYVPGVYGQPAFPFPTDTDGLVIRCHSDDEAAAAREGCFLAPTDLSRLGEIVARHDATQIAPERRAELVGLNRLILGRDLTDDRLKLAKAEATRLTREITSHHLEAAE